MLEEITLYDGTENTENWYAEPFTKRKTCQTPGQCGGDCNCGCPYNTMTEVETLPLISDFTDMFPDEWLAFITPALEDEDYSPVHGKLVAHSPDPNEIFNAQNTVLWNQCVYIFFNGDFEAMQASYGDAWDAPIENEKDRHHQPTLESQGLKVPPKTEAVPGTLVDLIYSALDQLYQKPPRLSEAIRRLRIAKVRAGFNPDNPLLPALDQALDRLEGGEIDPHQPETIAEAVWELEEMIVTLEYS